MKTRVDFILLGLAFLALAVAGGCGGDDDPATPGTPADSTAPSAVNDLHVQASTETSLTVAWTAPGDDGAEGTASQYDVRYSAASITEGTWEACAKAASIPAPVAAGAEQSLEIPLWIPAGMYVALKSADEIPNWSGLSNVVFGPEDFTFEVRQLTTEGYNKHPCLNDNVVSWVRQGVDGDEIYLSNLAVAYPSENRITDNGGEKWHPSSHGAEKVVWQGRAHDIDDWEIWSYSPNRVPRFSAFTDNEVDDTHPALAGGGNFAWLRGASMYEEVRYWNESMQSNSAISNGCCPAEEFSNGRPTADDFTVVWRTYHMVDPRFFKTYLWNGALTDLSEEINANMTTNYSLHDGAMAYEFGASPAAITYWDGLTTTTIGNGYHPSLYSGTIAYEVWDGQDWEIRFWDGSQIIEITDNDFNDGDPTLYGNIIAWQGRPSGGPGHIYYVKLPDGSK